MASRRTSSRLGWVAAVIGMVSPSQPSPAVIQRISISWMGLIEPWITDYGRDTIQHRNTLLALGMAAGFGQGPPPAPPIDGNTASGLGLPFARTQTLRPRARKRISPPAKLRRLGANFVHQFPRCFFEWRRPLGLHLLNQSSRA